MGLCELVGIPVAGFAADTGELWHYCSEVCKRSLRITGQILKILSFYLYYCVIVVALHEEILTYKNNNFKCRYELRFSFLF